MTDIQKLAGAAVAEAILIAVSGYGISRDRAQANAPPIQDRTIMERDSMPYVGVGCIVVHDGRVLMVRNQRDRWSTPGGLLEYGESPESAGAACSPGKRALRGGPFPLEHCSA